MHVPNLSGVKYLPPPLLVSGPDVPVRKGPHRHRSRRRPLCRGTALQRKQGRPRQNLTTRTQRMEVQGTYVMDNFYDVNNQILI